MVREKSTLGKAVLEPFDHRHDRIRVRCTDPQLLYADLPPISEEVDRLLLVSKQRSGNPKKRLARFRKFCRLPDTQEQLDIKRFFKRPHLCGHSRLPNAQVLGAFRKAAFMGDCVEGSKPGMMRIKKIDTWEQSI